LPYGEAFIFDFIQLSEHLEEHFLTFIFDLSRLNNGDGALGVDEVGSAGAARRLTLNSLPLLFEVRLNQL